MILRELADAAGDQLVSVQGDASTEVAGVVYDSRAVSAGYLFFCVVGFQSDGHEHAPAAVANGAVALCVERVLPIDVPQIVVTDVRSAMPHIAAVYYGRPADDMLLIGITGTNGKTTTAFLVESILAAAGRTPGLMGTIETHVAGVVRPAVRTTPESVDVHALLAEMRAAGVDSVAMEVTSHALALNRADALHFRSVGFTNLTQDHLDFHPTIEDYFAAKRSLFTPERASKGAVNMDDPYGAEIAATASIPLITFGMAPKADVRAEQIDLGSTGSTFLLVTPGGEVKIETSLVGPFNVSNCLAAAAVALQAGIGLDAIEQGIRQLRAVPGRFESIDAGQPFSVIVDYAHTPDSLDNVLVAGSRLAQGRGGRLIALFGAGGDRDRGKRPLMGMVAARLADFLIVTSDNPRSEVPDAIIGEILEGVATERPNGPDAALADRREAIGVALRQARDGDVVVIAGKGHETGQEFADRTIPFDDRIVAAEVLAELGYTQ